MDHDWFLNEYEKFCRHRAMENVLLESYDMLVGGKSDAILEQITEARDISLKPKTEGKFRRYKMTDLLDLTLPVWLIRDLIFEQQIIVFCAESGSYKSFIALALSAMLAHGKKWKERPLKKRKVVYLAGEGFPMFGLRRRAWLKHHGIKFEDDGLEIIDGTVNLLDDREVDEFIESMRDCDADLLTLDTLSTSTGDNENAPEVMAKAVKNGIRISRALKCAIIIIHHPGKDKTRGLRGHSSLKGNIDGIWWGERVGNKVEITTKKQRDGEDEKTFYFESTKVPLGVFDNEGIELDSLALTPCEAPTEEEIEEFKGRAIGRNLEAIILAMKINQTTSVTALAELMKEEFNCSLNTAKKRIMEAVPADTWTKATRLDKPVLINRFVEGNVSGQAHRMHLKSDDG
jgi:hypothetical protein